jgi:hypothetical protein
VDNELRELLLVIILHLKEIKAAVTKDIKVTIMSDDEIDFPGLD